MRSETACLVILLAGCGETAPPLDELPLRDALRADPEVVAAMPEEARQHLAARLEAARADDDASEPLDGPAADPGALIAQLDAARASRSSQPLIVGEIAGGLARAVPGGPVSDAAAPPLPPLEAGPPTPSITPLEPRALEGDAGRWLRALFAASGAHHLRRVVGWPAGAVAVGDTVYVNAAWLAALAPLAPAADAGTAEAPPAAPAGNTAGGPLPSGTRTTPAVAEDSAPSPSPAFPDAGVYLPPPPQPPPPAPPPVDTTGDSCAAAGDGCSACAGASDGSDDACDGTTDDGSDDACNSTTDDGADTNCQISRGRRRGGAGRSTTLTLMAPLAFLLTRKRR